MVTWKKIMQYTKNITLYWLQHNHCSTDHNNNDTSNSKNEWQVFVWKNHQVKPNDTEGGGVPSEGSPFTFLSDHKISKENYTL